MLYEVITIEAADMLVKLGMKRLKVPSGEITNHPFLRHLARKALPIILSTGMADMEEVVEAVEVIRRCWQDSGITAVPEMLTVLHSTSNYPAAMADVNLRAMPSMAAHLALPVGYSVITSYSIHYTKLYENTCSRRQLPR